MSRKSPEDPNVKSGSEFGQATVYLTPATARTKSAKEIIEDLRVKIDKSMVSRKFLLSRHLVAHLLVSR